MAIYYKRNNLLILCILFLMNCQRSAVFSPRSVYYDSDTIKAEVTENDLVQIHEKLENFANAIHEVQPAKIIQLVHKESGIFLDLKAQYSYEKLTQDLYQPTSYAYRLFFKKTSNNHEEMRSIREILANQRVIFDIFFHHQAECEIYIEDEFGSAFFELTPPILQKHGDTWYFARSL